MRMRNLFYGALAFALIGIGGASAQPIGGIPAPHAVNNAALQAISTVNASIVTRDGYAAYGDAPAITYVKSGSPCSLNSGNGDGGFQVKSADGKCWLISPLPYYDVREFGMTTSDDGTKNGPILTNIFSDTGSHSFYIPGNFTIPCGRTYTAASSVSFYGAGQSVSSLSLPAGCSFTQYALFNYNNAPNVSLYNFTVYLNGPNMSASAQHNVFAFGATSAANVSGLNITNIAIVGGNETIQSLGGLNEIIVAASGGATYSAVNIANNFLNMAASHQENQCIVVTTSDGAGFIPSAKINHNVCTGTGIEFDGAFTQLIGNDVSGWMFGAGLTSSQLNVAGTVASNNGCVISDNIIHDSPTGQDVNSTTAEGLENDCVNSVVSNNYFYNLGGGAVVNYGNTSRYIGNYAIDTGKDPSSGGCAFCNINGGNPHNSLYLAANSSFIGNVAYDDGAGVQLYGYQQGDGVTGATLRGNNFTGVTAAVKMGVGTTVASDAGFISTQTVSGASTLAFTNLDTSSYHRWRLTCHDVWPSTAAAVEFQVGEGAGPSWNTAATYYHNVNDSASGTFANANGPSQAAINLGNNNWQGSTAAAGNFIISFGDISLANNEKHFSLSGSYTTSAASLGPFFGTGAWLGDNNPITAIRILASSGNINATCTLEGFIQ